MINSKDIREINGLQFRHKFGFIWQVYEINIPIDYEKLTNISSLEYNSIDFYLIYQCDINVRNKPSNQELLKAYNKKIRGNDD